jgi:type I restriction enzyme S subunit
MCSFANGVNADRRAYGTGVPFINVLEIITHTHLRKSDIPGRVRISKAALDSFTVRRGDVLFNRTSETQEEVGLAAVYDDDAIVVFGGFVIRGRFLNDSMDSRYVAYGFRAPAVRTQIIALGQGAIRANIGQKDLKLVRIPVPPRPEQRAIAAALSDVNGLVEALSALIVKKRAIKQAAIQQLLTGKTRLPGFTGEWEIKRIGDISAFLPTANNPRADLNQNGDIEYIHYGDVHAHTQPVMDCSIANLPRIDRVRVGNAAQLQDGDLLIVDASEDLAGVGKSVEVRRVAGRIIVGGLHTILCRGKPDHWAFGFKAYLQFIPVFKTALTRLASGISVYALSRNQLSSVRIALPPVPEQKAIVAVLADMDAEIAALEQRREKTRAIKQGMMQELLTGRVRLVKSSLVGAGA